MTQDTQDVEHGRVELLLPWFVNNTLDADEYETVQRHVEVCDECSQSVTLLSSLSDVVKEDSTIPIIPEPNPEKLLASVEQENAPKSYDPFRGWRGAAAAAAVLVLVLVGRMAINVDDAGGDPDYVTATSQQARSSYVLSMQFDPELAVVAHRQILDRLEAVDVVSTGTAGAYRVTIMQPPQTAVEFDNYLSGIEGMEGVASVELVGIDDITGIEP